MERNADPSATDNYGRTALHIAARNCPPSLSEAVIKFLVQYVDIDARGNREYTALDNVCYSGRLDMVKTLLGLDADIEAEGPEGFTPLLYATHGVRPEIVKYLIQEAGACWAPPNVDESITDVLDGARAANDDQSEEWLARYQECDEFLKNWLQSSYHELFFQSTFQDNLGVPAQASTGWLQSPDIEFKPMSTSEARSFFKRVQQDSRFIADKVLLPPRSADTRTSATPDLPAAALGSPLATDAGDC